MSFLEQTEPDAYENHELEEGDSAMWPADFLARWGRLSRPVLTTSAICLGCPEDGGDGTVLPQPSLPACSQAPPGASGELGNSQANLGAGS